MLEQVQAIADEVGATLQRYMLDSAISDGDLASDSYRGLMDTLAQLEEAVHSGLAMDQADADQGLLRHLRSLPLLGARAQAFDVERAVLVERVLDLLHSARDMVEREAEPNLPVPDDLQRIADGWLDAAGRVESISARLPDLVDIEGWNGAASSRYGSVVAMQMLASDELQRLPRAVAEAYLGCRDLNRATLTAVDRSLGLALRRGLVGHCLPHLVGLYPRASRWAMVLADLLQQMQRMMSSSEEGSQAVCEKIQAARQQVAVVALGWPSGSLSGDGGERGHKGNEGGEGSQGHGGGQGKGTGSARGHGGGQGKGGGW